MVCFEEASAPSGNWAGRERCSGQPWPERSWRRLYNGFGRLPRAYVGHKTEATKTQLKIKADREARKETCR